MPYFNKGKNGYIRGYSYQPIDKKNLESRTRNLPTGLCEGKGLFAFGF